MDPTIWQISIAARTLPYPGEDHNGDAYFIVAQDSNRKPIESFQSKPLNPHTEKSLELLVPSATERILLTLVDATGHGREAAEASNTILACLKQYQDLELTALIEKCHQAAIDSRGAALAMVSIDFGQHQIRFMGVGDIHMQMGIFTSRPTLKRTLIPVPGFKRVETLLTNNGIVGYNLPKVIHEQVQEYLPGDMVAIYSDGIVSDFNISRLADARVIQAVEIASRIMHYHRSHSDDATIVVLK